MSKKPLETVGRNAAEVIIILIAVILLLLLGWVVGALGDTITISFTDSHGVTLAWDPSPDTNVVGYNVYYGIASRTYTKIVDVGDVTNMNVFGLVEGTTYYFAVTAYNILGMESDYSSEVSYTEPSPPIALLMSTNVATPRSRWTVLSTSMPGDTFTTNLPYPSCFFELSGRTNRLTIKEVGQ